MSVRSLTRPRGFARTAAVAVAALSLIGLWAPAATAAPAVTIPLDPPATEVSLRPRENVGMLPIQSPPPQGAPTVSVVDHWWGGQADISLPRVIDTSRMVVRLELSPTLGGSVTRTYASDAALPADQLVVTDAGRTRFVVDMPAFDPSNDAFGTLVLAGLDDTAGVTFVDPVKYYFRFVGSGSQIHYLAPELVAVSQVPCAVGTRCPATSVKARSPFTLTVPHTSKLRGLALGDLARMSLAFQAIDANGQPTGAAPIVMSSYSPGVAVTNSDIAQVTLPAGTPSGAYRLTIVDGSAFSVLGGHVNRIGITTVELQVEPANGGLRSDTAWGETEEEPTGSAPLVGIGAGMIVVAGVGAAAVLRPRRRTAAAAE